MSQDPPHLEVGQRLAAARGEITQAAFAERLGVDRKTVNRWESGERIPDGEALQKLWATYRINVTWLLTGHDAAPEMSPAELGLVTQYRMATELGRRALDAMLRALAEQQAGAGPVARYVWQDVPTVQEPLRPYGDAGPRKTP